MHDPLDHIQRQLDFIQRQNHHNHEMLHDMAELLSEIAANQRGDEALSRATAKLRKTAEALKTAMASVPNVPS